MERAGPPNQVPADILSYVFTTWQKLNLENHVRFEGAGFSVNQTKICAYSILSHKLAKKNGGEIELDKLLPHLFHSIWFEEIVDQLNFSMWLFHQVVTGCCRKS